MSDAQKITRFLIIALMALVGCDSAPEPPKAWVPHARWVRLQGQQCCPRMGLVCDDGRIVARLEHAWEWFVEAEDLNASYVDWQSAKDATERYADAKKLCEPSQAPQRR